MKNDNTPKFAKDESPLVEPQTKEQTKAQRSVIKCWGKMIHGERTISNTVCFLSGINSVLKDNKVKEDVVFLIAVAGLLKKKRNKQFSIQLIGNLLAGVALLISNTTMLPDGAFNEGVNLYSYMLILPSFMLWLALFAMQYMGLIKVWLFLVSGVMAMAGLVIVGMGG